MVKENDVASVKVFSICKIDVLTMRRSKETDQTTTMIDMTEHLRLMQSHCQIKLPLFLDMMTAIDSAVLYTGDNKTD